jgi:cell wall integrity and stress response component
VTETHGNQVTTITVGDSAATSPIDSSQESEDDGGSSISGGAIAGIVVGVVGGIALIVAAVIFFLAKRRSRADEDPQNKSSQMGYANARGAFSDNHSHTLSNGSGGTPQRMPTFTDNRLNTGTVLYPNGSPQSEVSLHDNQDYSRPVLRVSFMNLVLDLFLANSILAYQSGLILGTCYELLLNYASNSYFHMIFARRITAVL